MEKRTKEMLKVLAGSVAVSAGALYLLDGITPWTVIIAGIVLLVSFTGGMMSLKTMRKRPRARKKNGNIVVRTDDILERETGSLQCIGTVYGESIIAATMVNDLFSGMRILFGGEPKGYRQIMSVARRKAVDRMVLEAGEKGASIVTGHRLATTQVSDRSAEVISYGTAWKMII